MLVLLLLFFRKVLPPACHLERSPPEIPPSLCSVLLRSSTPLRFAQNDTGGRSRNPKGERQCRSDLAGRLKPALWKAPLGVPFVLFFLSVFFSELKGVPVVGKDHLGEDRLTRGKSLVVSVKDSAAVVQKAKGSDLSKLLLSNAGADLGGIVVPRLGQQ